MRFNYAFFYSLSILAALPFSLSAMVKTHSQKEAESIDYLNFTAGHDSLVLERTYFPPDGRSSGRWGLLLSVDSDMNANSQDVDSSFSLDLLSFSTEGETHQLLPSGNDLYCAYDTFGRLESMEIKNDREPAIHRTAFFDYRYDDNGTITEVMVKSPAGDQTNNYSFEFSDSIQANCEDLFK